MHRFAIPVLTFALAACAAPAPQDRLPELLRCEIDDAAALSAFAFSDPVCWGLGHDDQRGACLELREGSKYRPLHRSPLGLAVLRAPAVADFELEVDARQTGREYPHRDLCLVFAFVDRDHYVYAHLASAGDDNAHQIMLVDGADRRPVTTARNTGVAWKDGWHRLRLERRGSHVRVWFDGGASPVLEGEVPAWPGCVGFGSFDDCGRFRSLLLRGVRAGADLTDDPFAAR